jgi:hypothetical protein
MAVSRPARQSGTGFKLTHYPLDTALALLMSSMVYLAQSMAGIVVNHDISLPA